MNLLYSLNCLRSINDSLEIFAQGEKEDNVESIVPFLTARTSPIVPRMMKMTAHYSTSKNLYLFAWNRSSGSIVFVFKSQHAVGQENLLDRSVSVRSIGFASSSAINLTACGSKPNAYVASRIKPAFLSHDRAISSLQVILSNTDVIWLLAYQELMGH